MGDVFAFMSGLYFRGKLLYAGAFADPPRGTPGVLVVVPGRGLLVPETRITADELRRMAEVPIDEANPRYRDPLVRSARAVASGCSSPDRVVLLGSIATRKYLGPLLDVFGPSLFFPTAFVGRGDMSRGGLLERCVRAGRRLEYAPVLGSTLHGPRCPRLTDRSVEELAT